MEERFAHQMEIQKLHLALKLRGQSVEFVQRQRMLRPLGLRAEHTVEVAHISYFEIASCYHIGLLATLHHRSISKVLSHISPS